LFNAKRFDLKNITGIFLICFFLTGKLSAGSGSDYPGPREVINNFALNYNYNQFKSQDFNFFRFIKNLRGWSVQPEFFSDTTVSEIPLWKKDSGFIKPEKNSQTGHSPGILEFMNRTDLYYYSVYPFYGYTGWRKDLIESMGEMNTEDLTDHELFSLGTAYSLEASDILWSHSMYSDTALALGSDARQRDIARFTALGEKAISAYRALSVRNPSYQTRVGGIGLKLANEIISKYYELRLFGFNRQAERYYRQYVSENLYDPFWEHYGQSLLNDLEERAVLFTNGDNDTYPLLWLQSKGIRPDVRIINLSLLNDPGYADLLKKMNGSADENLISYTHAEMNTFNKKTILLENNPVYPEYVNYEFLEMEIRDGLVFPENILTATSNNYFIDFINSRGLADTLYLNLDREGKVLSVMELMAMNILNNNLGKHKIYFVKALHSAIGNILEEVQLNDKGLTLCTEIPEKGTIVLNQHVFDTTSINNFLDKQRFDSKPELYSRKIIYDLVVEAAFFTIYFDRKSINPLADRTLEFIRRFPPEESGISYYYLVALYQLGRSGYSPDSVQQLQENFFDVMESDIDKVIVSDDNPEYFQILNYYSSVLQSASNTGIFKNSPKTEKRISRLIMTIEDKLPDRQVLEIR